MVKDEWIQDCFQNTVLKYAITAFRFFPAHNS